MVLKFEINIHYNPEPDLELVRKLYKEFIHPTTYPHTTTSKMFM